MKGAEIKDLGLMHYDKAWEMMSHAVRDRSSEQADEIWLAEHHPVYTLGYAASDANIISNKDIPVIRTDRGGQVTYHGPGQLMIYFILNLKRLKWGPKKLICELEDLLIKLLKNNGMKGERVLGAPGIYVDGKKIASIGLKIKKGFCYHGISLNVDLDLMPFDNIVTCGIDSLEVTQMKNFLDISIDKVKLDLINLLKDQHHKAA